MTPKQLCLELISSCNLRCKMCPHREHMTGKNLTTDKVVEILSDVRKLNEKNPANSFRGIRFDGNSEPLVSKDLIRVLQECKTVLPEMLFDIITNGVLMNEDISRGLLTNTQFIHISMTGLSPKTYSEFQGSNLPDGVCEKNLQRVKDNVITLINTKNEMGVNTTIEVRYILCGASMDEFVPYVKYWGEQGVDQIFVSGLGDGTLKKSAHPAGKVLSYRPCERFGQIIVQANGDVILSCCQYVMEVVGNVNRQSFFDIMTSEKVLRYEKAHKELDVDNLPEICVNCPCMHVYESNKPQNKCLPPVLDEYRNNFLAAARGKKLVIWGTGPEFESVCHISYIKENNIAYIVDNNPSKWNSRIEIGGGYPVLSPDELKKEDPENTIVLVASAHFMRIAKQLKDLGVKYYYPSLLALNPFTFFKR
ncbi:MAG: SPASM domain-containing protein [Chitinispirillia bacterium]|nr:SPASM domain-containing protein [Chitinispirillia bacterium]